MWVRDFFDDFFAAAALAVARDGVDEFGEGEDGAPAGGADAGYGDEDEEGLVFELVVCEEGQTEVDENEVLGELGSDLEEEFGGELGAAGHVVVGVVLKTDAAEEE